MRTRKKELDKIVSLLEAEHDDVYELAEEVWKAIDEMRRDRDLFVVGVNYVGVGQFLYGTYDSKAMAEKDVSGKGNIRALGSSDTARVFQVNSPSKVFDFEPLELFDLK